MVFVKVEDSERRERSRLLYSEDLQAGSSMVVGISSYSRGLNGVTGILMKPIIDSGKLYFFHSEEGRIWELGGDVLFYPSTSTISVKNAKGG